MLQRYTFLEHPFNHILSNSRQMVSGLDKCLAVFYNQDKNKVEALVFDGELSPLILEDIGFIDKIRNSNKKSNWIKPEQVPFETKETKSEQLTFMDEEKSSVLELHFPNPHDMKADVIYFYFKNNIGNFKLSNTNNPMAITIKEVIQNLIYNQVELLLKTSRNNKDVHQKIANNISSNSYQTEIDSLKEYNFNHTSETYAYLLNELTAFETTEFVLSKAAITKISNLNLGLVEVKKLLKGSLELIINKHVLGGVFEISEHDIFTNNRLTQHKTIVEESLDKTAQYLDRYEQAVKLLISKNEKITGINIGDACRPSVSAAAISDILKKHQAKIIKLFNQYPEKWSELKEHFRPIKSLTEKTQSQSVKGFVA